MNAVRPIADRVRSRRTPNGRSGSAWHGTRRRRRIPVGSKPSHIGARFTRWLTSLNARSASLSRLISNRNRNVAPVRPCSAGSVRFSLSPKVWGATISGTRGSVFDGSFTPGHVAVIARSQCHGQGSLNRPLVKLGWLPQTKTVHNLRSMDCLTWIASTSWSAKTRWSQGSRK